MLVRFEDKKGRPFWVNPVHVRGLRESKAGVSTTVSINMGGWSGDSIEVPRPIDEVADAINAAMPLCAGAYAPEMDQAGDDEAGGLGALGAMG